VNALDDARQFWDREVQAPTHVSWMENLQVRLYINNLIGSGVRMWPMEWLEARLGGRRFRRALSIGCGAGALERELIARGIAARVDAFDTSLASLCEARKAADRPGIRDRIGYFAFDFNEPVFPRHTYDLVCAHQALHHVGKIEKLYRAVMRALVPRGVFYLEEYVGPSRNNWSTEKLTAQRGAYSRIPRHLRKGNEIPYPIQEDDPSEALRSDEILPLLRTGFRIVARADYGGNFLALVFPLIDWAVTPDDFVAELIERERAMLQAGAPSYYTILLTRPRRGPARLMAATLYFTVPKLRRLRVEWMRRLGRDVRY